MLSCNHLGSFSTALWIKEEHQVSQSYANLYVEPSFPRCSNYTVRESVRREDPDERGCRKRRGQVIRERVDGRK